MTDEMLELARANAAEAGVANVDFLKGEIEAVPLPDSSVDVVISNCVINLSTDKPAVFAEMARVLRPGGRIGISDVVAEDRLTSTERAQRGSFVGCIAGALSFSEYGEMLTRRRVRRDLGRPDPPGRRRPAQRHRARGASRPDELEGGVRWPQARSVATTAATAATTAAECFEDGDAARDAFPSP